MAEIGTKRTYKPGERLLHKLSLGYSIAAACKAEGIGRTTYYEWRKDKPGFAGLADSAIEDGTDRIEDVGTKRAIDGDNAMITLMLKARRKDKYGDKSTIEQTGPNGEPLVPFRIEVVGINTEDV